MGAGKFVLTVWTFYLNGLGGQNVKKMSKAVQKRFETA